MIKKSFFDIKYSNYTFAKFNQIISGSKFRSPDKPAQKYNFGSKLVKVRKEETALNECIYARMKFFPSGKNVRKIPSSNRRKSH